MDEQLILSKALEVNELIDRVLGLVDDGDRVPDFLRANVTFVQGGAPGGPLVFNVPRDADFFASRLNLFLGKRTVSLTAAATATEKTFRSCDWTDVNETIQNTEVNAQFEVSVGDRAFQSSPLHIHSAFSTRMPSSQGVLPISAYLGGLDFHVPYRIKRGTVMTVRVTPTFSRTSTETSKTEYRIAGVLTGFKKAKAFR